MKKISIFLILTSFLLMIVSATFVSAESADNYDYSVIVFNEANLGTHTDSNVYAKIVHGAIQIDPSKTLYCQNTEQTNAKIGQFSQAKLDEMYNFFKGYLSISGVTTLSKRDIEDPNRTIDLTLPDNQVMLIKLDANTANVQTKFKVNGRIVANYSEIAGRVYWLYSGNGVLKLNSDEFFGVLIAPDATVFVEGCGNYDGSLICKNLKTSNEVHQVKRTPPPVSTSDTTTPPTTTTITTTPPPTTTTVTTTTTQPTTTTATTTTPDPTTTSGTTITPPPPPITTTSQATITSIISSVTSDPSFTVTTDPSQAVTTSNKIVKIDDEKIPLSNNPKTEECRTILLVASFFMLLSGCGLLAYKKLKN